MNMALSLSAQESEDFKRKKPAKSHQFIAARLLEEGLERVDTLADGRCLFLAIAFSAGLAVDPFDLRCQINQLPPHFAPPVCRQNREQVCQLCLL